LGRADEVGDTKVEKLAVRFLHPTASGRAWLLECGLPF
jgi:hypothetical protein